jgi:hypothetical protein
MLRASVSLSRKISRDYNSTGYTVTFDGEIPHSTDDAEGVLEKVGELFHLADEALNVEIDRDRGGNANDRQQPEPPRPSLPPTNNGHANGHPRNNGRSEPLPMNRPAASNGNGHGNPDTATPKQLQFLQTMARRCKLSDRQLENRIAELIGRSCGVQQLSKKEAGLILDNLTGGNSRTGG